MGGVRRVRVMWREEGGGEGAETRGGEGGSEGETGSEEE